MVSHRSCLLAHMRSDGKHFKPGSRKAIMSVLGRFSVVPWAEGILALVMTIYG